MTAHEDRLRSLLHDEAADLHPAGDGLVRIRERVARRRRTRLYVAPGAAAAVAVAVVAAMALTGGSNLSSLEPEPYASSTGEPSPGPVPTASAVPTTGPDLTQEFTGIWPFRDLAAAQSWDRDAQPWAGEAEQVAQRFVQRYLAGTGAQVTGTAPAVEPARGNAFYVVRAGDATVSTLRLVQGTTDGPWTVVRAEGGDLTFLTPEAGDAVTAPFTVTGRVEGVDENIDVRLRDVAGREVAQAYAPAGSAVPWSAVLRWSSSDAWSEGLVTATTYSAKDGTLNRFVAVPVQQATGASVSGTSYAGLSGGAVWLYGRDGQRLRQLTYPPAGATDVAVAYAGTTVAWVRDKAGCGDTLNRLDSGRASTVVAAGKGELSGVRLSAGGALLAWSQESCGGGMVQTVHVVGGGAPERLVRGPSGMTLEVVDIRDDGALLLHLNDRAATDAGTLGLLLPGEELGALRPLAPVGSCYLAGAASFDAAGRSVAWETCDGRSRPVRFDDDGGRVDAAGLLPVTVVVSAAWHEEGTLLEVRNRDRSTATALVSGGRLTVVCERGCPTSPDW